MSSEQLQLDVVDAPVDAAHEAFAARYRRRMAARSPFAPGTSTQGGAEHGVEAPMEPVNVERARRRAAHLRKRAARRPIGSNGRRKDLATAAALEAEASRMDLAQRNLAATRARQLGLWLP